VEEKRRVERRKRRKQIEERTKMIGEPYCHVASTSSEWSYIKGFKSWVVKDF
jgi:hypothetical protein